MEPFKGRKLVIVTKHGKENVLAPILKKNLGVECIVIEDFDTDQFGTFTGEIARDGNQLEAARKKLLAGLKHSVADLGIASEGSFAPHPQFPWVTQNLELCLLVDLKHDIEAQGVYDKVVSAHQSIEVNNAEEAIALAKKWGFPEQKVILRSKNCLGKNKVNKKIETEEELLNTIQNELSKRFKPKVFLEPDLRAHRNPKRMQRIEKAAMHLVENLNRFCENCGHRPLKFKEGVGQLKCKQCATPSSKAQEEKWVCEKCKKEFILARADGKTEIDPVACDYCNP